MRATKINTSVKSSFTINPLLPGKILVKFDDDQHFKAIGPSLGLYGDWTIDNGFGIYGETAFSLLYGDYTLHFKDSDAYTPSPTVGSKCLHKFNKTVDLGIGFFWKTTIRKNLDIGMSLGYEFHDYYAISYLGYKRWDVIFNGGVVSLTVAF